MKKIMIVDDEQDIRDSIKKLLEYLSPDYFVLGVNSGNMCIDLLKDNEIPDLIILDIMMPGMSGWMVLDRLKENPEWRNIPVILLTARRDDFAKKNGRTMCKDYIEKPFDIKDFKKRIDKIIN